MYNCIFLGYSGRSSEVTTVHVHTSRMPGVRFDTIKATFD